MENYFTMRNKFIKREITVTEWNLYCMEVLNEMMTEKNKRSFKKCLTVKIKYGIIIIEREIKKTEKRG